ncbi:hypothetical protein [Neoactinobaculum massilliense]|uniref:hypothetical protein n=1 Tax=Neoactinobaculum massilliense TaxID=2364794 RepID=UPI0019D14AF3|nr:hypothetical protein [Neoactinobaculum massilliense]
MARAIFPHQGGKDSAAGDSCDPASAGARTTSRGGTPPMAAGLARSAPPVQQEPASGAGIGSRAVHVRRRPSPRALLLALAVFALLCGLNAALLLLGTWAPVTGQDPAAHGIVMVGGFLGGVIALERAQALAHQDPRHLWAYLAPLLLVLGGVTVAIAGPLSGAGALGKVVMVEGSLLTTLIYIALWDRAQLTLLAPQMLSGVALTAALLLSLRFETSALLPLLAAFLVITIASERAELAQLTMGPRAVSTLLFFSVFLTLAAGAALLWPAVGRRVCGAGLLGIAAWLAWRDVPRRLIHATGLPRYMAWALLGGYVWLAIAGVVWLASAGLPGTPLYDAAVHCIFIGFAFTMIMAHAPIVFPAVISLPVPYQPFMYVPVALLNAGLLLRVIADVALGQGTVWIVSGVVSVLAILTFLATIITTVIAGPRGGRK